MIAQMSYYVETQLFHDLRLCFAGHCTLSGITKYFVIHGSFNIFVLDFTGKGLHAKFHSCSYSNTHFIDMRNLLMEWTSYILGAADK